MTTFRGRAGTAAGALIILAAVGIPAAAYTRATATATQATALPAPAQGVDVSAYTTVSSWPQLRQDGNSFAGVEATEGNYYQDPDYAADVASATGAGLYVIPYAFANPYGSQETTPPNGTAAQQADYAVSQMRKATPSGNLMLPLALDMEPDPYTATETGSNTCYGLTASQMVTWIQSFISEAESDLKALSPSPVPATPPVIYTSAPWWDTCTGNSTAFGNDPLWVANYGVSAPAIPAGWGNYTFWQYSNNGTVSGITGAADVDYLGPTQLTSAEGTAIGGVRLSTLTSLQGQADTFASSSLPPGLSLSSAGIITGTPAAIGSYDVTVAPSSGAVPSSMTFTWRVHGAVTLSPGNHTTVAGFPVSYQVPVSDPDQGAGYAPSVTAAGLPPGMQMSSGGLITGWPYAPGTYTVKLSASDGLGGAASASFTWTVGASGNSGTTGTIRQAGGSGRCLNVPGGNTANGTQPVMWTCGSTSYQKWTWVQDGTIRYGGKCLQMAGTGSAASTPLELEPCGSGNGEQRWQAASYGQIENPASGKCVYLGEVSPPNGYKPVAHACGNDVQHHFLRPAAPLTSGEPSRCLAAGASAVDLVTCANASAQHWVAEPNGQFKVASSNGCLYEKGTAAGSGVAAGGCSTTSRELWTVAASSANPIAVELRNAGSGLCLTVPSGSAASGTPLVMEPCTGKPGTPADTWHIA